MAINLATKYSNQVDEVFRDVALTNAVTNGNRYDFVGARAVKVYGMGTAKMNDYTPEGANRYGIPEELQDTTEELILSQRRSFTFTIDATNAVDSPEGVREAGAALRRQLDQVVIPELDAYRLSKAATLAGHSAIGAVSASTAYSIFIEANAQLSDDEVPFDGRVAFVSNEFATAIKQCDGYTKATEIAQNMIIRGQIGDVDGVKIVLVPKGRMPAGAAFVIIHSSVLTAPQKLAEYKIHDNPPGIAGHLVEGLVYYDAFITANKRCGAAVQFSGLGSISLTAKAADADATKLSVGRNAAGTVKYFVGDTVTLPEFNKAPSSGWTELPADGVITATAGKKVAVCSVVNGKCVAVSAVIDVVVG